MTVNGASGSVDGQSSVRHTGFTEGYSTIPKEDPEERKIYGDPDVSGIFAAMGGHAVGGRDNGAMQARCDSNFTALG